jgi:PAS domain S-box-containing protein
MPFTVTVSVTTGSQDVPTRLLQSLPVLLQIIDAAPSALIVASDRGDILLANRAAEALFGYAPGELAGRPVEALVPERFAAGHPEFRAGFAGEAAARPMGAGRDLHGRRKDGSEVPVEIGLNPLDTGQGKFVLAAIVDLSERKVLERELRVRVDELARVDRQKDEFLAMLAHELRNPLAPMRNAVQIMNMAGAGAAAQRQARGMLERQLHHLVRLVDDLLDVARIISGRIELRRAVVDLNEAVTRGLETAQPVVEARGHELVLALDPEGLLVEGDLVRLSQVVANLVTNAARYSPTAGRIWVTTAAEGESALLRVRDEGVGISAGLLPHVFDLFVQGETGLARTQGGLGIGLNLVRRIVSLHGGTAEATSDGPGRGAEFVVRLPAYRPAGTDEARPTPRVTDALSRRVLVVDDNVDAAESIAIILRMSGYAVRTVHDGQSALDVVPAWRPDVIVLDIGLPDIDGYQVAEHLRADPRFVDVPLVAVTGYGQESDRRRARAAGIDCHLTKPVDLEALEDFIAHA